MADPSVTKEQWGKMFEEQEKLEANCKCDDHGYALTYTPTECSSHPPYRSCKNCDRKVGEATPEDLKLVEKWRTEGEKLAAVFGESEWGLKRWLGIDLSKEKFYLLEKVAEECKLSDYSSDVAVRIINDLVLELPEGSCESVLSAIYKSRDIEYILKIAKLAVENVTRRFVWKKLLR